MIISTTIDLSFMKRFAILDLNRQIRRFSGGCLELGDYVAQTPLLPSPTNHRCFLLDYMEAEAKLKWHQTDKQSAAFISHSFLGLPQNQLLMVKLEDPLMKGIVT